MVSSLHTNTMDLVRGNISLRCDGFSPGCYGEGGRGKGGRGRGKGGKHSQVVMGSLLDVIRGIQY